MEGYHKSVLLREVIGMLNIKRGKWYLDATIGDGGYSVEILRLGGKVLGVDCDPQALERVEKRFKVLGLESNRYKLVRGNFRDINNLISESASPAKRGEQTENQISKFAGAIFDIGVSSLQLMNPERGFSFINNGPLDMRMDPDLGIRALDLVNNLSRKELNEIFEKYGEEKYSWGLAGALVLAREIKGDRVQGIGIRSTIELARIIEKAAGGRKKGQMHPATKVFQALRITVNDELGALQEGLNQAVKIIEKNGRIIIISFHSLEDRIVKLTFRKWEENNMGKILTKKPIIPAESEVNENIRSRSAKLRGFEIL